MPLSPFEIQDEIKSASIARGVGSEGNLLNRLKFYSVGKSCTVQNWLPAELALPLAA
jgi:hypothetical protein